MFVRYASDITYSKIKLEWKFWTKNPAEKFRKTSDQLAPKLQISLVLFYFLLSSYTLLYYYFLLYNIMILA
jgi:hypothetical protein